MNRKLFALFMLASTACGGGSQPTTADTEDLLRDRSGDLIVEPTPIDQNPTEPGIGPILPSCGGAGMTCCASGPECASGLECNPSGLCRQPCGGLNERCCGQTACAAGLECQAGSCSFSGSGGSGPGGPGNCTPCAMRECGFDNSCGDLNQQYCGGCDSGKVCSGGFCQANTGQCTLTCPSGMTCRSDNFGMYCDF